MDDIYTSELELMGEDLNRPRIVILNTIAGSSLMCMILEESEDSFLVALPAKLLRNEDKQTMEIDPYLPVPYARFIKSGILFVTPVFGTFEFLYLKYLLAQGIDEYPDGFSEEDIEILLARMEEVTAIRAAKGKRVTTQVNPDISDFMDEDYDFEDAITDEGLESVAKYLEELNNRFKH
jgi:hypothetical protein